jgi:hypothetical protein
MRQVDGVSIVLGEAPSAPLAAKNSWIARPRLSPAAPESSVHPPGRGERAKYRYQ